MTDWPNSYSGMKLTGYDYPFSVIIAGMSTGNRPLRKDAERNRDQILDAARLLFARRGLGVGLNEIAQYAGVGVGTVYRHFPHKDQLIDVLFEQRRTEIVTLASQALEDPDPWHGLTAFLDSWLQLHLHDHALTEVFIDPQLGKARLDTSRDSIAPLLDAIADRARDDGYTRPDFRGTDVFFIQLALAGLMDRSRRHAPDLYCRYLAMFLEGVRTDPDPAADLPMPPVSFATAHALMTTESGLDLWAAKPKR